MKITGILLVTSLFCLLPALSAQQTSPNGPTSSNPQDVPQQQPGTNNPDVSKQRNDNKPSASGDSGSTGAGSQSSSKKKSKGHKQNSTSSQSSSTASQ